LKLVIIIIIIRLQSSRPQVSSSDGGLGPFPTADYHLAGYKDPPEDSEYVLLLKHLRA